jgi:cellulose synthase (UDP-forming)
MYFATMWSYLSGFASALYIAGPALYMAFGWLPVTAFSTTFFAHLLPYLVVNQLMFLVVGWGIPVWRGQQYSFALFPLWIRAVTSAVGNVAFGQPLGFVVTPKTRQGGVHLRLVWPQLVAIVVLWGVVLVGLARLSLGLAEDGLATLVNVIWAVFDLALLSVIVRAATFRPADSPGKAYADAPGGSAAEAHGRVGAGSV